MFSARRARVGMHDPNSGERSFTEKCQLPHSAKFRIKKPVRPFPLPPTHNLRECLRVYIRRRVRERNNQRDLQRRTRK